MHWPPRVLESSSGERTLSAHSAYWDRRGNPLSFCFMRFPPFRPRFGGTVGTDWAVRLSYYDTDTAIPKVRLFAWVVVPHPE